MTDEQIPDDRPLSDAHRDAAAAYHAPPDAVPREAMWAAIQAARGRHDTTRVVAEPFAPGTTLPMTVVHTTRRARRDLATWIGAAAVCAGIAIVAPRTSSHIGVTGTSATASTPPDTGATAIAWQVASAEHFGDAETMLTTLAASPSSDLQSERQLTAWSRDLLESTRLLMDSPAGRDPKRRVLLQELELVLVQLVESGPAMRADDRSMMDELLSRSAQLLTRIRTTVPAGLSAPTH